MANARPVIYEDEPGWDPATMGNRRGWKDGVWYDNSGGGSNAGRPGYVMAEDGTWVPESFYNSDAVARADAMGRAPIEW